MPYNKTYYCPGGPDDGYVAYWRQWYTDAGGWEDPNNYTHFTTSGPFPMYYWYGYTGYYLPTFTLYRSIWSKYWARFPNIDIPQAAVIRRANVSVFNYYNWWWGWKTAYAYCSLVESDDYTAPKSYTEFIAETETDEVGISFTHPWNYRYYRWVYPGGFDVTHLLQEIVNRSGWASGNAIGIHVRWDNFYGIPWFWGSWYWKYEIWSDYWLSDYLYNNWNQYNYPSTGFWGLDNWNEHYWPFRYYPFWIWKGRAILTVEYEIENESRWFMVGL